jgi:REP element-mobilizing transposase RayT
MKSENPVFMTTRVINGKHEFDTDERKQILVDSLRFCIENKGLILHAWVIMINHIHLIGSNNENRLPSIMRDFKRHTSARFKEQIGWDNEFEWKFWGRGYHPVQLVSKPIITQKINYIHHNPVKARLVSNAIYYEWSSALDYFGKKGKLEIEKLDMYF